MLELASEFGGQPTDEIVLGRGEALFFKMDGVSLIEDRVLGGHYQGGYSGLSIPLGHLGGRALRYNLGASRGHYVQGSPVPSVIDTGELFITNRRVIFQGASQTRECRFAQLIRVQHFDDGSTTLSQANRQRPITIRYGPELSSALPFHLDLALAHYRGAAAAFVADLRSTLDEIDGRRPSQPQTHGRELGVECGSGAPSEAGLPDEGPPVTDPHEPPFGARRCERRARRWR